MTATDELRKLLDEHGVEHEDSHEVTVAGVHEWDVTIWLGVAGVRYLAVSCDDCDGKEGCVYLYGAYLTPKQAIAATLRSGKCELIEHGSLANWPDMVCWSCSACGFGWHHSRNDKQFSYCPNCGAKAVGA